MYHGRMKSTNSSPRTPKKIRTSDLTHLHFLVLVDALYHWAIGVAIMPNISNDIKVYRSHQKRSVNSHSNCAIVFLKYRPSYGAEPRLINLFMHGL